MGKSNGTGLIDELSASLAGVSRLSARVDIERDRDDGTLLKWIRRCMAAAKCSFDVLQTRTGNNYQQRLGLTVLLTDDQSDTIRSMLTEDMTPEEMANLSVHSIWHDISVRNRRHDDMTAPLPTGRLMLCFVLTDDAAVDDPPVISLKSTYNGSNLMMTNGDTRIQQVTASQVTLGDALLARQALDIAIRSLQTWTRRPREEVPRHVRWCVGTLLTNLRDTARCIAQKSQATSMSRRKSP